jgi:hypothetical protein
MVVQLSSRALVSESWARSALPDCTGVKLLSKPFTYEQLAARVRDMLDDHYSTFSNRA